jgi:hypothetical protein
MVAQDYDGSDEIRCENKGVWIEAQSLYAASGFSSLLAVSSLRVLLSN